MNLNGMEAKTKENVQEPTSEPRIPAHPDLDHRMGKERKRAGECIA